MSESWEMKKKWILRDICIEEGGVKIRSVATWKLKGKAKIIYNHICIHIDTMQNRLILQGHLCCCGHQLYFKDMVTLSGYHKDISTTSELWRMLKFSAWMQRFSLPQHVSIQFTADNNYAVSFSHCNFLWRT